MSEQLLQIQAECVKVESKPHKSVRITMDSQEELPESVRAVIMGWHEKTGHLCFLTERPIDADDAVKLEPLVQEKGKYSPSQILRFAIYKLGQSKGIKKEDEQAYYEKYMAYLTQQVNDLSN